MKLRVDINLDNAAFDDFAGAAAGGILIRLAGKIVNLDRRDFEEWEGTQLMDESGNTVGGARIVRDVTVSPKALGLGGE